MTANDPGVPAYQVGTLRYTLPRLLLVSVCMLLATQSLALLCNHLVPSLQPILLDRAGASAKVIALVVGTIPQIFNFVLNPLISTCSDKTRTRYGRRMPYLIWSAPVMAGLLAALAWSGEIAALLGRVLPGADAAQLHLGVLIAILLLFSITYFFPGTVVYYLIADVIPQNCLVRYMSFSSFCATGLTFLFNYFILDLAANRMKPTLCAIGGLYLLVYILLFRLVREGEYPPVADKIDRKSGKLRTAVEYFAMFFRQCFRHRIFIFLFIAVGLNQASTICRGMFNVLFATKDLQMTVAQYGQVIGYGALASALIVLPMGRVMSRFHPIYLYFIGGIIVMTTNVFGFFFVRSYESFMVVGIAMTIVYTIQNLAWTPMGIALMPRDKYGQFCSAQGMVVALALCLGSYLGGVLTDIFGYRVMFVWDFVVTTMAMAALVVVMREWRRFGGKNAYQPPPTD